MYLQTEAEIYQTQQRCFIVNIKLKWMRMEEKCSNVKINAIFHNLHLILNLNTYNFSADKETITS